jgi:hypothetical protein
MEMVELLVLLDYQIMLVIYYAYDVYADTSNFGLTTVTHFMNYSNTTTYKQVLHEQVIQVVEVHSAMVGLWRSTSAISTIYLYLDNVTIGSRFNLSLYGIAAA